MIADPKASGGGRRVVLATPTYAGPYPAYCDALEATHYAFEKAGISFGVTFKYRSPYISHARAEMLRKALDAGADDIVFVDHDMEWKPEDMIRLVQTPGDVVSALYRFKLEPEEYMGAIAQGPDGEPIVRNDGCIKADWIPAGFMKITKEGVDRYMRAYPELCFGPKFALWVDLFNHGAEDGLWWGEDYAFSRRWNAMGGDIWVLPDIDLIHHDSDRAYAGNYHQWLRRQPGGDLHAAQPLTKSAA